MVDVRRVGVSGASSGASAADAEAATGVGRLPAARGCGLVHGATA